MAEILKVEKIGDNFKLTTTGREFEARSVLIATGSVPRRAGFKGEDEFFLEEVYLLARHVMDSFIEVKKLL